MTITVNDENAFQDSGVSPPRSGIRKSRVTLTLNGVGIPRLPSTQQKCRAKRAYSEPKAREVANRRRYLTGEDYIHYECLTCCRWHVGHDLGRWETEAAKAVAL